MLDVPNLNTTLDEQSWAAFMRGDAYVFSCTTSGASPTVAAGSFLNIVINNNGSRKAVIYERRFDNNIAYNAATTMYGGIASPAAITSPTVSYGGSNINDNYGTSPDLLFTCATSTTRLNNAGANAVPSSTGYLPIGDVLKLMQPRMISPGKSFGQFITGAAAGLGAVNLNLTFYIMMLPAGV